MSACDLADLVRIAREINQLNIEAHFLRLKLWPELADDRDFQQGDEAENLRLQLARGEKSVAPDQWSRYMGVLALALAGQIHTNLWPTDEYKEREWGSVEAFRGLKGPALNRLATAAARAAAYGEAFCDLLAAQNAERERNRRNGPKAHQPKQLIIEKFIQWAIGLPRPHQFDSVGDAMSWFRQQHLTPHERSISSAETFPRRAADKLKKYCKAHELDYPFA